MNLTRGFNCTLSTFHFIMIGNVGRCDDDGDNDEVDGDNVDYEGGL